MMNPEKFLLRIFLGWSTYVLTIDKGHEGGRGDKGIRMSRKLIIG